MKSKNRGILVSKYGMLISLAFVFSYIEAMIPIPIPIPGMKLGLANLVTIVGLYTVGISGTVVISLLRIILVGLTFGNLYSMVYGLAGGTLSLAVMVLCRKGQWLSRIGVSIVGGTAHNIGQIVIAAFVVHTAGVLIYLPALLIAGMVAGGVIGLLGGIIIDRIQVITRKS